MTRLRTFLAWFVTPPACAVNAALGWAAVLVLTAGAGFVILMMMENGL